MSFVNECSKELFDGAILSFNFTICLAVVGSNGGWFYISGFPKVCPVLRVELWSVVGEDLFRKSMNIEDMLEEKGDGGVCCFRFGTGDDPSVCGVGIHGY